MEWPKFRACLEAGLLSNLHIPNDVTIRACVNELLSAISKALTPSTPGVAPVRTKTRNTMSYV